MLLLFCLVGTVIDLIIEERKELKAAKNLPHTNNDGITEVLANDSHALNEPGTNNITLGSNDDDPLLNIRYPTFPYSGILNNISNRLILILAKLCSKLF